MAWYGARAVGSTLGISDVLMEFDGGGTFAAQDLVKFDGSGEIVVATAAAEYAGVALEAGTSSSEDVAVNVTPYLQVLMDNDNDSLTFAAAHVGEFFAFTGGTGAMQIDTDTAHVTTQRGFICLEYNPQGYGYDSDTSVGKFQCLEMSLMSGANV